MRRPALPSTSCQTRSAPDRPDGAGPDGWPARTATSAPWSTERASPDHGSPVSGAVAGVAEEPVRGAGSPWGAVGLVPGEGGAGAGSGGEALPPEPQAASPVASKAPSAVTQISRRTN